MFCYCSKEFPIPLGVGKGCFILMWHFLSLPYKCFSKMKLALKQVILYVTVNGNQ